MKRVVEDHDGGTPGGGAGVLDRVLHRFAPGVEQGGAFVVVTGSDPVEHLGDLEVGLVWRGQEAGVGVLRQLGGGARDHGRRRVAHRRDRDTATEVDERVAVDVDDHAAARGRHVHVGGAAQPGRQCRVAAGSQLEGAGAGNVGVDAAHLVQLGSAEQSRCHGIKARVTDIGRVWP